MQTPQTNIHLEASRKDWLLIRTVYGKNGGAFAHKMLASRVAEVASELRALGITTTSPENRKRLVEICKA